MTDVARARRGPTRPVGRPVPDVAAPLPDLLVDEQLCFALYSASRAFASCYRAALAATGLTYSQYLVMLVLWEEDRARPAGPVTGGLSLTSLGQRLGLDNGTLSPLIKRLGGLGLLTRRRSSKDERMLEVACTPAGRALYRDTVAAHALVADATGLAPHELAGLRDALRVVTQRLRAESIEGTRHVG